MTRYSAERRRERVAAGDCLRCGLPRGEIGTATYCRPCADAVKERSSAIRRDRVKAGRCSLCSEPRGSIGSESMCRACADRFAEYKRKRKERATAGAAS